MLERYDRFIGLFFNKFFVKKREIFRLYCPAGDGNSASKFASCRYELCVYLQCTLTLELDGLEQVWILTMVPVAEQVPQLLRDKQARENP